MAKFKLKWLAPILSIWDYVYHKILGAPVAGGSEAPARDAEDEE